jgi:hypothetical protein
LRPVTSITKSSPNKKDNGQDERQLDETLDELPEREDVIADFPRERPEVWLPGVHTVQCRRDEVRETRRGLEQRPSQSEGERQGGECRLAKQAFEVASHGDEYDASASAPWLHETGGGADTAFRLDPVAPIRAILRMRSV